MRRMGMGFVAGIALASMLSGQEAKSAGSAWDSRKSAWEQLKPGQKDDVFRFADGYKDYLRVARSALLLDPRGDCDWRRPPASRSSRPPRRSSRARSLIVNSRDRALMLVVVGLRPHRRGLAGRRHAPRLLPPRPEGAAHLRVRRLTLFNTIYYGGIKNYQ